MAHPDPYNMVVGSGCLSERQSGRNVELTTHAHTMLTLKEEKIYAPTPPLDHHGLYWGELCLMYNYRARSCKSVFSLLSPALFFYFFLRKTKVFLTSTDNVNESNCTNGV